MMEEERSLDDDDEEADEEEDDSSSLTGLLLLAYMHRTQTTRMQNWRKTKEAAVTMTTVQLAQKTSSRS